MTIGRPGTSDLPEAELVPLGTLVADLAEPHVLAGAPFRSSTPC